MTLVMCLDDRQESLLTNASPGGGVEKEELEVKQKRQTTTVLARLVGKLQVVRQEGHPFLISGML